MRATGVIAPSTSSRSRRRRVRRSPAVGCAEATRYIQGRSLPGCTANGDEITYVSLGEGATSEGEFWESLNTACRLHLPILYVVADNGYAISVRSDDQAPAPIHELVRGFPRPRHHQDRRPLLLRVAPTGACRGRRVRAATGPYLIHAKVTRPYSHSAADTQAKYRPPEELAEDLEHDPITQLEKELLGAVCSRSTTSSGCERKRSRSWPTPRRRPWRPAARPLHRAAARRVAPGAPRPARARRRRTADRHGEAITQALHELMAADERIRVFGEDVADAPEEMLAAVEGKGGVSARTRGLQRTFGLARCFNTPLAEANIVGRAVGQGIRGLRPCPEIQFFDYIWPAMQQIKSEAATIRWRSNGAFSCPMVLRVAIGGYLTGGAIWHSQCGESIFTHVPGLVVLFPSRARDAAGLLRAAFRCEDPVLFLEHKHLLRQPYTRDSYPSPDFVVPIGKGSILERGDDLTIVTYGATVERSRRAMAMLAEQGVEGSVELIDLRSLAPWDQELVGESVNRTGRALVVHEDIRTSGFGAEVAAWIAESCFDALDAPVTRVGAQDCHVAYEPSLEEAILPQADDIADAARRVLTW